EGQTIALDGKTLRGALAHASGHRGAYHLMHVWATEQQVLLAHSKRSRERPERCSLASSC
ncbi:MAG: hypothetical protein ABI488_23400, partial [Polyangiaceae bacterium]